MIHCSHTSRYHWGEVGTPLHHQRGEWQISRVYAEAGMGEQSLYHAKACLELTKANDIKGFDLTFAYEAMARACSVLGNKEEYEEFKDMAINSIEFIEKREEKEYVRTEIENIVI
ncbi:hypothetical protein KHQ82_02585 [Mycoplasmatota bacterium]|nr:hypothetical protein KHQ82_02585 [Mycoplasmatota bacterium]